MELNKKQPKLPKKLWKILQIALYMTKIGKTKLNFNLQTLLKRGKSVLVDSNYYSALTCRSNDENMSFVSPREYEFSCSNTPAHRKNHKNRYQAEDQINAVQKVLEMLNLADVIEASPLNLPGLGRSPYAVRQLRVTDSPFAVEGGGVGWEVDKDCEEFIEKFYKSLKKERRIAALESPSPYHLLAR